MSNAVRSRESVSEPEEDDWFGEGSSFDSGEDLASALFALAGTVDPSIGAPIPADEPVEPVVADGGVEIFDWVEPDGTFSPASVRPAAAPAAAPRVPQTWGVRNSASELPPRRPGASGWSIRNSVQVLHRTDEVLNRLREEAVLSAFSSAASVFQQELEARPRRRRRSPRFAA